MNNTVKGWDEKQAQSDQPYKYHRVKIWVYKLCKPIDYWTVNFLDAHEVVDAAKLQQAVRQ
jgi:hypothetical protein